MSDEVRLEQRIAFNIDTILVADQRLKARPYSPRPSSRTIASPPKNEYRITNGGESKCSRSSGAPFIDVAAHQFLSARRPGIGLVLGRGKRRSAHR